MLEDKGIPHDTAVLERQKVYIQRVDIAKNRRYESNDTLAT